MTETDQKRRIAAFLAARPARLERNMDAYTQRHAQAVQDMRTRQARAIKAEIKRLQKKLG